MYAWVTSVKRVIINLYLNGSIIYLFHKLRSQRRCMFFPQCNIQYLRLLYVFVTGQAALSKTIHFGHGFYSAVPLQRLMIRDRKPISQRMSGLGCTILFSWDVTPSRNLLLVLSNVCIGLPPNTVRPRLSSSLGYVFFFFFFYIHLTPHSPTRGWDMYASLIVNRNSSISSWSSPPNFWLSDEMQSHWRIWGGSKNERLMKETRR